jgi:hypothetical protein
MADTWREFWEQMEQAERRWRFADRLLGDRLDVEGIRYTGTTQEGLWAAEVLVPMQPRGVMFCGVPSIVHPGKHVVPLRVEARTPAELVMLVERIQREGAPHA